MGRTESELAHEVKTANIALAVTRRLSECQLNELGQLDELEVKIPRPKWGHFCFRMINDFYPADYFFVRMGKRAKGRL